jgi:hypothetical protein
VIAKEFVPEKLIFRDFIKLSSKTWFFVEKIIALLDLKFLHLSEIHHKITVFYYKNT